MSKFKAVNMIDVYDWDKLVTDTYGKPYSFQQQDDCKPRGVFNFSVPLRWGTEDRENEDIPMKVNGPEMGVTFKVWLATDPETPVLHYGYTSGERRLEETTRKGDIGLVWDRNFYPDVTMVIEDLHKKGLLEEGDYAINIDW